MREPCSYCGVPYLPGHVRNNKCEKCRVTIKKENKEAIESKALAKFVKDVTKSLAVKGKDAPDLIGISRRLGELVGGAEGIADLLYSEFKKVVDYEVYKPSLIHSYLKTFVGIVETENASRLNVGDFADLSEADLKGLLTDVAVEAMKQDPAFLQRVIREAGTDILNIDENDPELNPE